MSMSESKHEEIMFEMEEFYPAYGNWSAPKPLTETKPLPPFPSHVLPDTIKNMIESTAEFTQTPVEMAATIALGVLAAAAQGKWSIEAKPGWTEPLNLFILLIAKPGERKSALMKLLMEPLHAHEKSEAKRLAHDIATSNQQKKILMATAKHLGDLASKGKGGVEEAQKAAIKANSFIPLSAPRFTCGDTTPERLVGLISENGGRIAIMSSEGGLFDSLMGRYSNTINIDAYLQAHAGDTIRIDRIGRESEYIQDPALTICVTTQPDVLSGVMRNSTFQGRGLTARFLYCVSQSLMGYRKYDTQPIDDDIKNAYERLVVNILRAQSFDTPTILSLSPDAEKISRQFAMELEPRLIDDLVPLREWAAKYHGAVLRIAGIIHVVLTQGKNTLVSSDTMSAAVEIGRFYEAHALAAFGLMGTDKAVIEARYVLNKLEGYDGNTITRRNLLYLCKSFKHSEHISPALAVLIEHGYLLLRKPKPTGGRPSEVYEINPIWLEERGKRCKTPY